jgi:SNF2 family DNA or RNA helicase
VADHKWIVTGTPVNTSIKDLKSQLKFIGIEMVDEMFKIFCMQSRGKECIEEKGKLMFFLRSIMIRHTQRQTYRGTGTTLMSLPAKSERSIAIVLSEAERKEYDRLDAEAKKFYVDFKTSHSRDFSKHYLKLSQRLTPMRVACSGGCIPLDGDTEYDEEDPNDSDEEKKPAARKKQEKYSDFCFTAKFNVLLRELKRARDEDPTSKSLVFSQYTSTMNWLQQELPKHGFEFRTFSGSLSMKQRAKALHDFQLDPPTTVFLLSMR